MFVQSIRWKSAGADFLCDSQCSGWDLSRRNCTLDRVPLAIGLDGVQLGAITAIVLGPAR